MDEARGVVAFQLVEHTLFVAVPLVFSLLHLLLFAFQREKRENLYFTVLTAAFALAAHGEFLIDAGARGNTTVVGIQRTAILVLILAAGRFYYAFHQSPAPRAYWGVFALAIVAASIGWIEPRSWTLTLAVLVLSSAALLVRNRVAAGRRGEGRWILTVGLLFAIVGGAADLLIDLGPLPPFAGTSNPWLYGGLGLLVSMSVHLAYQTAHTNKRLETKLVEVRDLGEKMLAQERDAREQEIAHRLLEADNRRKTDELADARELQLSMLPSRLPESDRWDVAATMITATEVGGDYYDFDLDERGALTIAVGDAVGHGARAGALVAATKSLFSSASRTPDIAGLLGRFDQAIGRLAIDRLFVALLLARFEHGRLQFASAGMPPPLRYRRAVRRVEESPVGGLPLGSPLASTYGCHALELEPGDAVLFMSDGFPELPDRTGEELGYDGARLCFERLASGSAQTSVDALAAATRERTLGEPPPDDVTFVVVRVAESFRSG